MATIRVVGRVIDQGNVGVSGVRVETWGKDLALPAALGNSTTDAQGQFVISLDQALVLRTFGDHPRILLFKAFRGDAAIPIRSGDSVPLTSDNLQVRLIVDLPAAPGPSPNDFMVHGQVTRQDGSLAASVLVKAFDKDLRSEEFLGQSTCDDQGHYEISYTAEQFNRAEKGTADLTVRAFSNSGIQLASSEIIFNAPSVATVNLVIPNPDQRQLSEYEQLLVELNPILDGVEPADLTDDDVTFLVRESGDQYRQRIEFLRQGAKLWRDTQVPTEAFYGWEREGLPQTLDGLLGLSDEELRRTLETALAANIVPAKLRDSLDQILRLLDQLRLERAFREDQTNIPHQVVGQLVNQGTTEALVGYRVYAVDLDTGPQPKDLGYDITNTKGLFGIIYRTPPGKAPSDGAEAPASRHLRLRILDAQGTQIHQTEVQVRDNEVFVVPVPVPAVAPTPSATVSELIAAARLQVPPPLAAFLTDRGIRTLADLRTAGGIGHLDGLPVPASDPAVQLLDAHANLSVLSSDVKVNTLLIDKGFKSVSAIANAPRTDFVGASHEALGDFKAFQTQAAARAQDKFLNNILTGSRVDWANRFNPRLPFRPPSDWFPIPCGCKDCEAALSPLAYLADLLEYAVTYVKNNNASITLSFLTTTFHQPFDKLPASCEEMDKKVRQVRICVEVLRSYLSVKPPTASQQTLLDAAEKAYRLAAYITILTKLGTSYVDIRLARTADGKKRQQLADRLGIDLSPPRPDHLDALFLDASASPPQPNAATEAILEQLFGLVDTTRDPLAAGVQTNLQTWQREHLRTQWKVQDFPPDLPEEGRPIIDPDVIGPDDFRMPLQKTNLGDPDQPFDVWVKRAKFVKQQLDRFRTMTRMVNGKPVPDVSALFTSMYQAVSYGPTSVTAWTNTTLPADFDTLHDKLASGMDMVTTTQRIATDLELTADAFFRLLAIRTKDTLASLDSRNEKVQADEWDEFFSILTQVIKLRLFPAWLTEESAPVVLLGPKTFWISLREPKDGHWPPPPPPPGTQLPYIDPEVLQLDDLPEPTAGKTAIGFWKARQAKIQQIYKDLKAERETHSFTVMLQHALGDPAVGDPLPDDLNTLKQNLANNVAVDATTKKIADHLHMSVTAFNRLMVIKAKDEDPDPLKKPTEDEYAEVYKILTTAQKEKREYPTWLVEEQTAGMEYWTALKARLPLWRASADVRQEWQGDLRLRSQPPLIDPDVIGPGDLKEPSSGHPAFDLWQTRRNWVGTSSPAIVGGRLAATKAAREGAASAIAGLDTIIANALGVPATDIVDLRNQRDSGGSITKRLDQLSLDADAFVYLLRIRDLVSTGAPVLESEWTDVYSILVQVEKRRAFAEWRDLEKAKNLTLGPDFFTFPVTDPTVFPPPPPPPLPAWRASMDARRTWQDTLQARMDQDQATSQALRDAVSETEERTLPMLRDALLLSTDAIGPDLDAKAGWVTDHLLIDGKASGCQQTTRIAQAIETLQSLLFSLRTHELDQSYPNLELDADQFDEEWVWLGSYATWRAAMFVFLYPDNIALPQLLKWQTPAFQTLVNTLRSNQRLTPEQACEAAKTYSNYYRDICTLTLEASCEALTRIHTGDCRDWTATTYRPRFYMFARGGATNTVYWSSYDAEEPSPYAQSFWQEAPGFKDQVVNLVGAVPYRVSSGNRFIYLFARILEKGTKKLVYNRYDLEKQTWAGDDATDLELPKEKDIDTGTFTAVVKQHEDDNKPPHLAIRLSSGSIYDRQLNRDGTDWADGDWKPLVWRTVGQRFSELSAMVEVAPDEFFLFASSSNGTVSYRLFGSRDAYLFFGSRDDGRWQDLGSGDFRGAFFWPDTDQVYVYFGSGYRSLSPGPSNRIMFHRIGELEEWLYAVAGVSLDTVTISAKDNTQYNGLTYLKFLTLENEMNKGGDWNYFLHALYEQYYHQHGRVYIDDLVSLFDKDEYRDWKEADAGMRRLTIPPAPLHEELFDLFEFGLATFMFPTPRSADQVGPSFTSSTGIDRIAVSAGSGLSGAGKQLAYQNKSGQVGVFRSVFSKAGDGSLSESDAPIPIAPDGTGPSEITERYSEPKLQFRRLALAMAFQANEGGPESNLTYLKEAYYFVPMHLGLQLQSRGQYTAALDWFRTVYDFNAPVGQRKIYYGLSQEESLAYTYKHVVGWLLDPLNPHAIASTRAGTYTRFTLQSIIRCFLEFADSEFTQDTAESVPRARMLYLTALDLLEAEELKKRQGSCADVIGALSIDVGDPQWIPVWNDIKTRLNGVRNFATLSTLADQVVQTLQTGEDLAVRFQKARAIVAETEVQQPAPPQFEALLEEKPTALAHAQTTLLAQASIADFTMKVAAAAAQDSQSSVARVTGINRTELEQPRVDLSFLRERVDQTAPQPVGVAGPARIAPVAFAATVLTKETAIREFNPLAPSHVAVVASVAKEAPLRAIQLSRLFRGYIPAPQYRFCIPPNPVLNALRLHAELNLYKLRNCRNIAGAVRELDPYAAPTDTVSGLPMIGVGGVLMLPGKLALRPTQYRYGVLIERAKQLAQLASQVEASMLSALEKRDAEYYSVLKARQDVQVARAGVRLQELRSKEAQDSVKLAQLQQERAQIQADHYKNLLDEGLSALELLSLEMYRVVAAYYQIAAALSQIPDLIVGLASGVLTKFGQAMSFTAQSLATQGQIFQTLASYERRAEEWDFQRTVALQDVRIGVQQVRIAEDQVRVVGQEQIIAQMQADNAQVIMDFLSTKFTNVELYDWMSNILQQVYKFFLQQATAMAQLAASQLAFERQAVPPQYIQGDYWQPPSLDGLASPDGQVPDRRGLTGSVRLLQDITQLDQFAFQTNQRKLQLTKTISLVSLAPAEFQRLREIGVMRFATPMELFDRDFPGHYLRLIRRVRTSVIALIPPSAGIRATLSTTGSSRVVIGGDVFQTVVVNRGPETVALSSPRDATGLFELEPQLQPDMLLPFEGIGVNTTWEFRMPKAANFFDFNTIADVLVTIDYTAFNSFDYQQQVVQTSQTHFTADRPFSFRQQFADPWYDLHNPDQSATPMVVGFSTRREDFPSNLSDLKIAHVVLYFSRADGSPEVPVSHLYFSEQGGTGRVGGGATSVEGVISTRKGNAGSWMGMIGKSPVGDWELALPDNPQIRGFFKNEDIKEMLFVITYSARTPDWPN